MRTQVFCVSGTGNTFHHWSRANGVKYHHPEVNIADLLDIHTEEVRP